MSGAGSGLWRYRSIRWRVLLHLLLTFMVAAAAGRLLPMRESLYCTIPCRTLCLAWDVTGLWQRRASMQPCSLPACPPACPGNTLPYLSHTCDTRRYDYTMSVGGE